MEKKYLFQELYVLPRRGTHLCRRRKKKKNEKRLKKFKKVSKWLGAPSRPRSPTKQMVWRRYQTGLSEMMSIFDQILMKNDAFYL